MRAESTNANLATVQITVGSEITVKIMITGRKQKNNFKSLFLFIF